MSKLPSVLPTLQWYPTNSQNKSFDCKIFLFPTLAVNHHGQKTIDMILDKFSHSLIGSFSSIFIKPFVSLNKSVCTCSLSLYSLEKYPSVFVLKILSPVEPLYRKQFLDQLFEWSKIHLSSPNLVYLAVGGLNSNALLQKKSKIQACFSPLHMKHPFDDISHLPQVPTISQLKKHFPYTKLSMNESLLFSPKSGYYLPNGGLALELVEFTYPWFVLVEYCFENTLPSKMYFDIVLSTFM